MSIFEYNARLHEENLKSEGYMQGREEGREEGLEEGIEKILQSALQKGYTPEQIIDFTGVTLEKVLEVQKKLL